MNKLEKMSFGQEKIDLRKPQIDHYFQKANNFLDKIREADPSLDFDEKKKDRPEAVYFGNSAFFARIDGVGHVYIWMMSPRGTVNGGKGFINSNGLSQEQLAIVHNELAGAIDELFRRWDLLERWQEFSKPYLEAGSEKPVFIEKGLRSTLTHSTWMFLISGVILGVTGGLISLSEGFAPTFMAGMAIGFTFMFFFGALNFFLLSQHKTTPIEE